MIDTKYLRIPEIREINRDFRLFSLGIAAGLAGSMLIDSSNFLVEKGFPDFAWLIFSLEIIFSLIAIFYIYTGVKETLSKTGTRLSNARKKY